MTKCIWILTALLLAAPLPTQKKQPDPMKLAKEVREFPLSGGWRTEYTPKFVRSSPTDGVYHLRTGHCR